MALFRLDPYVLAILGFAVWYVAHFTTRWNPDGTTFGDLILVPEFKLWRVLIIGSQANDRWEMKITGPNAFERTYTLEGSAGA